MSYPLIVGNWKMHLGLSESLVLAGQISENIENIKQVDVVLCPPSIFLYPIFEAQRARPKNLYFGVQNIMNEEEGAFTGEISAGMIKGVAKYAIVGHSERRRFFSETDETVAQKTKIAIKNNLIPIVCVGEKERFHIENHYDYEVKRMKQKDGILYQAKCALEVLEKNDISKVVIAYEPVWAIGTANAADGAYAAAISYIIKTFLGEEFGELAREVKILYGGSVTSKDTEEFMLQPSIEGLLVGGSSIRFQDFVKICKISSEVKSGRSI